MHYTFIMTNRPKGTLYIGETDDLLAGVAAFKDGEVNSLAPKHQACKLLMWFETHETQASAKARQTEMLKANRSWVVKRLRILNPKWVDLAEGLSAETLADPQRAFPSDTALAVKA